MKFRRGVFFQNGPFDFRPKNKGHPDRALIFGTKMRWPLFLGHPVITICAPVSEQLRRHLRNAHVYMTHTGYILYLQPLSLTAMLMATIKYRYCAKARA